MWSPSPTAVPGLDPSDVATVLQRYGITPTQQRVEIAAVLLARHQHLSADQLLSMVRGTGSRVSKATVYNTLGLFARKGLVRAVIVDPTKVFYDSNVSPHHHLYHVETGALSDIDADGLNVQGLPDLPEGTVVDGVDVVVRVRSESQPGGR